MDSLELKNIVEEILEREKLTLGELAEKTGLNRSNLSTLLNNKDGKKVSPRTLRPLAKHFSAYFSDSNNATNNSNKDIILDRLSRAMADQARANLKHADNYGSIITLIEAIREGMAKEEALNDLKSNLDEVRVLARRMVKKQDQEWRKIQEDYKGPRRGEKAQGRQGGIPSE